MGFNGGECQVRGDAGITKESIIKKTYCSENLLQPLFALQARGPLGPAAKEG